MHALALRCSRLRSAIGSTASGKTTSCPMMSNPSFHAATAAAPVPRCRACSRIVRPIPRATCCGSERGHASALLPRAVAHPLRRRRAQHARGEGVPGTTRMRIRRRPFYLEEACRCFLQSLTHVRFVPRTACTYDYSDGSGSMRATACVRFSPPPTSCVRSASPRAWSPRASLGARAVQSESASGQYCYAA